MYTVEGFHLKGICGYTGESFKSVCDAYIEELFKNSKTNYANMMRESEAHFLEVPAWGCTACGYSPPRKRVIRVF